MVIRIRVEENYIAGLSYLHNRATAVDSLRDEYVVSTDWGGEKLADGCTSVTRKETKSSVRKAWQEMRDYTQREVQSREAMVGALKQDVLRELVRLKVCLMIVSWSRRSG